MPLKLNCRWRVALPITLSTLAALWPPAALHAQRQPDPVEAARESQRELIEQRRREQTDAAEPAAEQSGDIIADSQFEDALPPLDPELSQPLPPIEDIDDVSLGSETIDATAPAASPATPASNQAAATPPGDPFATDGELAAPLTPLPNFDVNPPVSLAEIEDEKPPLTRYSVEVEGLDLVGMEGRFRALSALDNGDGEGANGAVIAARALEDEALALRIMRSEGFYDGVVSSVIQPPAEAGGRVTVTIVATPGERYQFDQIAVEGPETQPPGLALEALKLRTGDPIVAAAVEAAEAGISLQLPQQGYPFVEVGARDIVLDERDFSGDYTLPVEPGPRSSFGGFSTTGTLAFDAEHVGVLARFKRGELYDNRKVDDLREAMVATGLFNSVAVEPRRTGQLAADGTEAVDLLVTQNAGPARRLAATGGYSTGQGFRIDGSWTHRNLFPPEGSLTVSGVGGTREQGLSVAFRRANAGLRDRTVLLSAAANRQDYDAYEALTFGINGRISRDSTPIWQKKWTWSYGFELLATREDTFQPARGVRDFQNFFIGGLNGQLAFDSSDSLLDPTKGYRALVRLSPEIGQTEGDNFQYLRSTLEGSTYLPLGDAFVLAARARVGSIVNAPRNAIAPSRRLYGGGGGSVRGYGYQRLGPLAVIPNPKFDPTDPEEEDDPTILTPIGGRSLTEFSLEARYRFGNFGVVGFVDAGQAYESSVPKVSGLSFGAGIGGRYYTNFGPLRLDIATPLNRRPGDSRIAIYISIGQAF